MRSYEIEGLEPGKARAANRDEVAESPDLAARAALAGRTEALAPAAVLRLQRAAGNGGVAAVLDGEQEESPVKDVIGRGGGSPLDAGVREQMEASFGADFSDVRVHTGASAAASAQAVDAHAYTVGNEIVLGDGHAPGSGQHDRTLAHELTHVVQQRSGPVDGTPAAGGIALSDPSDRFERAAEATADAVLSSGRAPEPVPGVAAAAVQRQEVPEEEEEVQALAVQRQEEEPEEEEEVQALAVQRQEEEPEEEEEVQALAVQRQEEEPEEEEPVGA